MDNNAAENTDKEIWRKIEGDYYSPSIHVTKSGGIGINVGGHVVVAPIEEWHVAMLLVPQDYRLSANKLLLKLPRNSNGKSGVDSKIKREDKDGNPHNRSFKIKPG